MSDIKRLEQMVDKYREENSPLIIKKEVVNYSLSEEEFEDVESGNPRVKRIIKCLNDEKPYKTLGKSIIVIGGFIIGVIGGIKVYNFFF